MDFFYRNIEAAQQQARNLTISAGNSAKSLAEQLSEQTKTFAEQAATVSNQAAEQASQRWKGINFQEALQIKANQREGTSQAGPSAEELQEYGITPDFKEFVRSLTYSTFRDFPLDQLPDTGDTAPDKVLTPWQEKHALLVVQEVKEINELRFVLCPKRMHDAQFWIVYFSLARKYMPPEAFDPGFKVSKEGLASESQRRLLDLQTGIRKTFETARQTASRWRDSATNTMQPAETSAQLHDLVETHSRGTTPRAASAQLPGNGHGTDAAASQSAAGETDLDRDLEAYLQTISHGGGEASEKEEAEGSGSESAADLDEYLNELKDESEKDPSNGEEEDAVDIADFIEEGTEK